jgi:hypothetical protein
VGARFDAVVHPVIDTVLSGRQGRA